MPAPKLNEVPKYGQEAIYKVKLLPGGTHFKCECHLLVCPRIQADLHHIKPQEAGEESSDDVDNIAILCSGCHDMLHRLSVMLTSLKAKTRQTPYEIALDYARALNEKQMHEVASNLLSYANIVAQYRVLKADRAIAGADGNVMIEDIPREFFIPFKQISKEIKRGDDRPIGMANLALLAVLEITAKHRPELRDSISEYIHQRVIMSTGKRPVANSTDIESFDERSL